MCPGSDIPEISVSSSDNYRSPFHPEAVTLVSAANLQTPTDLQISSPSEESAKATKVRAYGLLGYTRSIDLHFEINALHPERIFYFEGKRYKIASVVEMGEGQLAINAVSIEYRT
tara:strand:+ start:78 stop:422 length:345 start_codon:yes stop_codon:yes gene_type:complete